MKVKTICETCEGSGFMPLSFGHDYRTADTCEACIVCEGTGCLLIEFKKFTEKRGIHRRYKKIGIKYLDTLDRVQTKTVSLKDFHDKNFDMPPKCAEVLSKLQG